MVGTHDPVLVYWLIFSASSAFSVSGHSGKQYMIRLPGSMSLISWFSSLNGGSLAGMPPTRSAILSLHHSLNSESFRGGRPIPCNGAHTMLPSCKPGPMQATACSCPKSRGERGSPRLPTRCHSSSFDSSLGQVEHHGTLLSCELDRRFLGTTEAPIRIIPGPVKSRTTPKHLRNGVPNMMS